jgi:hypothetical protein
MVKHLLLALSLWICGLTAALADVVSAGPTGFLVKIDVDIARDKTRVFQTLLKVDSWWDKGHTYSGDANNLSIKLEPGGCFCEIWPRGAVEHLRVLSFSRDTSLTMGGGLGPLQNLGDGVMRFALSPNDQGSHLTLTYRVWGFDDKGLDKMAMPVNQMLSEQVAHLKAAAESADK